MYKGIPASEGIAIGKILLMKKEEPVIVRQTIDSNQAENEKNKLSAAIAKSKEQLQKIQAAAGDVMKEILDAHLLILEDEELIGMIHLKVDTEQQDIVSATHDAIEFFADMMASMEDEYMKERAADLRDIGYRIVMNLLGKEILSLLALEEPVIIAAHDITPSDTAQMRKDKMQRRTESHRHFHQW